MMKDILQITDLVEPIKQYSTNFAYYPDNYFVCRFALDSDSEVLSMPVRMAGLVICLVREGYITGEIEFVPFRAEKNTIVTFGNATSIKLKPEECDKVEVDMLFLTPSLVRDLNLDFKAIDLHSLVENRPAPVLANLSDYQIKSLSCHFEILALNAYHNIDQVFSKNIARSQVQSLLYVMLQMHAEHVSKTNPKTLEGPAAITRQKGYVQDFMRLLQLHHTKERSVSFYADKLFISPKYLSHLIKEATGKSAADWIGDMVIMEAKNMLRFSNRNIQQVAYDLNFTTQSSFGKYFKHITGLSPSEFQKL